MLAADETFVAWRLGICTLACLGIIVVFFCQLNALGKHLERARGLGRFVASWGAVMVCVWIIFLAAFAAGTRSDGFPLIPHGARLYLHGMTPEIAHEIGEAAASAVGGSMLLPPRPALNLIEVEARIKDKK